jgi:hypothetical protein
MALSQKEKYLILIEKYNCWRVDREALDGLEATWTGNDRENENIYSPRKVFFAMVTLSTYLSPSWEQIMELTELSHR